MFPLVKMKFALFMELKVNRHQQVFLEMAQNSRCGHWSCSFQAGEHPNCPKRLAFNVTLNLLASLFGDLANLCSYNLGCPSLHVVLALPISKTVIKMVKMGMKRCGGK